MHSSCLFVPVVKDKKKDIYKVSAKECIDRKDLQTFHDDLDKHMTKAFERNIGVVNEATREGNKSVAELKKNTLIKENQQLEKQKKTLQKQVEDHEEKEKVISSKIKGLEGVL